MTDHSANDDAADDVATRLAKVKARVRDALRRAGRPDDDATIVAVSKRQPAEAVQAAYLAGQRHFGESYVQEALPKLERLESLGAEWHFIGRIQSNKTRSIAERFDWVHTLERPGIAHRLGSQRPAYAPPLNVLLQVSLAGESQKGGVRPEELRALADAVLGEPRLSLRGLMTIPPADLDTDSARRYFAQLQTLFRELADGGYELDTLSMGMSADFELALEQGSNCVRVGTAIFGARD
ncbi:MAG: YggS family pyridoxal phosphate-dependent enzyme [Gammaproteobacteria bacterium]|nr:YggS family pyridoxal phosphate-dependent enzyme [Gammaproteobacteria bacterium]